MSEDTLSIWTVYERPADHPEGVIARRFEVYASGPLPTPDVITGDTLAAVRAQLPPGLHRMVRDASDPPSVVESWL